ncbi:bifunctional protein-disulfide isomerase/oxidoreductase DsbC [Salinimonas sediminis]|uniref:Thiol:disulfide interchange protein n=1 Tax=Salinimonas sediminis TaxID=2303538 RepID=A0A346NIT8_9ALTE|nr:bifunctional protein-disulfide isomerase/oxidoreductase DsbC [Salinimonas sediminis]AXR05445.1 bifunctional protein-disulfide isomerase/oxidoreductase DsbC [Salinimonas sediminis]
MFQRIIKMASVATLLITSLLSQAQTLENTKAVEQKLENQLGLKVRAISEAQIPGLLQVTSDKGLFYISDDGRYFMQARIFDMDNDMANVTENALAEMRLDGVKKFSDSAIQFNAKDEKHVITVFTDITCGYCRKMHKEIEQLNALGISVHYLAFPRSGLATPVYDDMVSVWCAKDPKQALTAAKQDKKVAQASCDNNIAEQFEFGQSIGVNGTPNIILEDGTLIPGYQPAGVLAQALDNAG